MAHPTRPGPIRPQPLYRWEIMHRVCEQRVFAIVRTETAEQAQVIGEAVLAGGLRALEITLTFPGALSVIAALRRDHPDAVVGAGTVLDASAAFAAIDAGAQFVVAPNLDAGVVRAAHRHGRPVIPGVGSVTELIAALDAGADAVKVFPASTFGPTWIQEVRAPLPTAPLIPTGGIGIDQIPAYLMAGAVACGVGSALTRGSCSDITARTADVVAAARP